MAVRIDAARAHSLAQAVPFIDRRDLHQHRASPGELADAAVAIDVAPAPHDDADDD